MSLFAVLGSSWGLLDLEQERAEILFQTPPQLIPGACSAGKPELREHLLHPVPNNPNSPPLLTFPPSHFQHLNHFPSVQRGSFSVLTLEEVVALLLRVLPHTQRAWALISALLPTSFDRELIAELPDYVCISKSFFLSWKVSSSKLGFPLHPLSPGVNPPFAGRVGLVSTHRNLRCKRKREGGILREKSGISWMFRAVRKLFLVIKFLILDLQKPAPKD